MCVPLSARPRLPPRAPAFLRPPPPASTRPSPDVRTTKKPFTNLKEIIRRPSRNLGAAAPRGGVKLQERVLQMLVDLHDRSLVTAPVAVVGGGKDGDDVTVVAPVVPFHHKLVCPCDEGEPIRVVVLLGNVLPTKGNRRQGGGRGGGEMVVFLRMSIYQLYT